MQKSKTLSQPKYQISLKGTDEQGRDAMLIVISNSPEDLRDSVLAALSAHPIGAIKFEQKIEEHDSEIKCPKCGSACYDNRQNRRPDDKRPLVKCQKCAWRLWEHPRTDTEIADNALWK